tara:strand:+ start:409 stop:666 length:258 start_codon:yes stop_codon:yes gene_type:complete
MGAISIAKKFVKGKKPKTKTEKPQWEKEKEIDRDLSRYGVGMTAALLPGVGNEYDKRKRLKKLQKNRRGTQTTPSITDRQYLKDK